MDKLTKEQRSKNMQAIKNKGTKDEVLLAKKLWHIGLRYRKNDNSVFGKPDLTFKRYKIASLEESHNPLKIRSLCGFSKNGVTSWQPF